MNTFAQIKLRLAAAFNDLGEALTAALAWIEEGESLQALANVSKQAVLAPGSRFEKSVPVR